MACNILLVGGNEQERQVLAQRLALFGGSTIAQATNGIEALTPLVQETFDLALIDSALPDLPASDFCWLARRRSVRALLLVVGNGGDSETVLALESGANDYIARPFGMSVLLARLRAHLRQRQLSDDADFHVGPFVFRPGARMLVRRADQKRPRLTETEAAILKHLYRAGDRPIPREELLRDVWRGRAVDAHAIETHVSRLRRKLERDPRAATILVTERGGYRLAPLVQHAA